MQPDRQSEPEDNELVERERITLKGLDRLFEDTIAEEPDSGLTLAQAGHYYGLSAKEIKTKIKQGEIPAVRSGERKKWRIYPLGLPAAIQQDMSPATAAEQATLTAEIQQETPKAVPKGSEGTSEGTPEGTTPDMPKRIQPSKRQRERHEEILDFTPPVADAQEVMRLKSRLSELEVKLEAAAFRNGYLEAKLEWAEGQVRLLTHQPQVQSFLQKFFGLFK